MDVNCLPDDVLARIFSQLPPLMLLDSIPLVCKRWHRLSKHHDTWRNFNLIVPYSASEEQWRQLIRLAKAAPYLNCVNFYKAYELRSNVLQVVRALLKGRKIVKTLYTMGTSCRQRREITQNMLEIFAPSLRQVFIILSAPRVVTKEFHESINNIMTTVSELPRLHSLGFHFYEVINVENYRGQLGKGCHNLERIVLRRESLNWSFHSDNHSDIDTNFVLDILECKKDVLQEIEWFDIHCVFNGKLMNAIVACENLVSCKIFVQVISIIKHMSKLCSLGLFFPSECIEHVNCIKNLKSFIQESPVIERITKLSLLFGSKGILYCQLLDELLNHMKQIQVFHVHNNELVLSMLLLKMEHINSISLHKCSVSVHHIEALSSLKQLKSLKVTDLPVYQAATRKDFHNSISKLQSVAPQISVVIDEMSSKYGRYDMADFDFTSYDHGSEEFAFLDYMVF